MALTKKANENLLKEAFMGAATQLPTQNWYVGLSTSQINTSGSAAPAEPLGFGYSRVSIPRNATHWAYSSSENTVTNSVDINFPVSTGDWGLIQEVFIARAGISGVADVWFRVSLTPPLFVQGDTVVKFAPNTLVISRENR